MTERLRVAIVHYHLRPGGVTRVIANAAHALADRGAAVAVLAAGPADALAGSGASARAVDALAYEAPGSASCSPERLAAMLGEAAGKLLGREPDVWHVHNHSLGKNCALPRALLRLCGEGMRLLLQIHDFPEDGRPDNYRALRASLGEGTASALGALLYPRASHVHYAVLNSRDRRFLLDAGADAARVHLLPDPVFVEDGGAEIPAEPEARFFLYPTRAIRRKNLGEFLLWAAAAAPGERFGVTLAPTSAADLPGYRGWIALADRLHLPVEFEMGLRRDATWRALLGASTSAVTTSMAEGFGLAFLEPWLAGRPIAGRNLPEITADFTREGIVLDGLYERLDVPATWLDAGALRRSMGEALLATYAAYGRPCPRDAVERAMGAAVKDGMADFGRLDTSSQAAVVTRVASSAADRAELRPPALVVPPAEVIARNRRRIAERHGLEAYGYALEDIYRALAAEAPGPVDALDADALLDRFLAPERLCMLGA